MASELDIISNALRLKEAPKLTRVPQPPSPAEFPARPRELRPNLRIPPEELEEFESMWDVPVRSW